MPSPFAATRLALMSAVATVFAGALALSGPAQAATYWCNDGTAVSNAANCKIHGGYTPIARANPGVGGPANPAGISDQAAPGNLTSFLPRQLDDGPCIFDRWGMMMTGPGGCRLPAGKQSACLKSGGALGMSANKLFCIPRQPASR